jgi:hypothetical protein
MSKYKDCICFNCEELTKEYPECTCIPGPLYCKLLCDPCPKKDKCDKRIAIQKALYLKQYCTDNGNNCEDCGLYIDGDCSVSKNAPQYWNI